MTTMTPPMMMMMMMFPVLSLKAAGSRGPNAAQRHPLPAAQHAAADGSWLLRGSTTMALGRLRQGLRKTAAGIASVLYGAHRRTAVGVWKAPCLWPTPA